MLSPVIETLVLLDRLLYLQESSVSEVPFCSLLLAVMCNDVRVLLLFPSLCNPFFCFPALEWVSLFLGLVYQPGLYRTRKYMASSGEFAPPFGG